MARTPRPTRLKIIDGTYRPSREVKSEPKPKTGIGPPPADFNRRQKILWGSIARSCPVGLMTRMDRMKFARYVILIDAWFVWLREWNASGNKRMHTTEKGALIEAPEYKAMRRDLDALHALESEFGFSPASRTRIDLASYVPEPVEESKLKKYAS